MEKESSILVSNLKAIELLSAGSYRAAITAFGSMLRILIQQVSGESDDTKDDTPDLAIKPVSCEALAWSSPARSSLKDDTFKFYDKAIHILGADVNSVLTARKHNKVSVIVLYNMALAFHLMAAHSATDKYSHLNTALNLYKMALNVNKKSDVHGIDNFLSMAILNNMCSIHAHSFNMEHMQGCLESLKECLDIFRDSCELADDGVELFHMNVIIFYGKNALTAPTA
jgi:tetratricopeptide (TPR) repeat protein